MKSRFFAIVVFLLCGLRAEAQSGRELDRKAEQQAFRQQLLAKIERVKHEKLTKVLGLDEQTAPRFFELYKPAEQDIQGLVRERNEEMVKLQELMKGARSDGDVEPEMQRIRDLNERIENRQQRLDTDLKSVLSARQRARLLVFEHEFNQKIRTEVAKRRESADDRRKMRQQLRQEKIRRDLDKRLGKPGPR